MSFVLCKFIKWNTMNYYTVSRVDHPRVCGEKEPAAEGTNGQVGSPPRMRGKVLHLSDLLILRGITPAYAGKRVRS